ncbi:MAG: hypothetical protein ACJATI_001749 [Halioglobus sp.]
MPGNTDEEFQLQYYENKQLSSAEDLLDDEEVILQPVPADKIEYVNNLSVQSLLPIEIYEIYDTEGRLIFSDDDDKNLKQIDFLE